MKVLITSAAYGQPAMKENIKYLESFAEVIMKAQPKPLEKEEILECWKGCDGIIAGLEWYTEEIFAEAPKSLKVISRYGVGCDHVDILAAKRAGITVTNTPGANAGAVAELAVTHMLALGRQIITMDGNTRAGKWIRPMGIGLEGRMLGLIGYGAIGKQVARMVKGFGMSVIIFDPYTDAETAEKEGVEIASNLDELYRRSDILSLHVPETDETRHMINRESISKMKEGVCIINAARGGLIDIEALEEALVSGRVAGAGLDVFEKEPPEYRKIFELPNVILTPHLGGNTVQAAQYMGRMAIDNLKAVLDGRECRYQIN